MAVAAGFIVVFWGDSLSHRQTSDHGAKATDPRNYPATSNFDGAGNPLED